MSGVGVTVVTTAQRRMAAAQTRGLLREEAWVDDGLWSGVARTGPGETSGWHHHGDWDTVAYVATGTVRVDVMEEEPIRVTSVDAWAGDFIRIPARVVHREANPASAENQLIILRAGSGPLVVDATPEQVAR